MKRILILAAVLACNAAKADDIGFTTGGPKCQSCQVPAVQQVREATHFAFQQVTQAFAQSGQGQRPQPIRNLFRRLVGRGCQCQ